MLDQTQLNGCDCDDAANGTELIDIEMAQALALSLVNPIRHTETVPLARALGRICAKNVSAPAAMPAFDNSAMDGFAVRVGDLAPTPCLPIAGCVAAGDLAPDLPKGAALRIYTGAPLPAGADAVIKVEDTVETDGQFSIAGNRPRKGQNIRKAGSDQPMGACLLHTGQRIAAHHVGLLAANGVSLIDVTRRPCVGVMSTGNELLPNTATGARIHDANRPMLLALAEAIGAETKDLGVVCDTAQDTIKALGDAAQNCDLILSSGAVSMGGKDHMRDAVLSAGGQIDGWRVAIKPGKPVMFGRIGQTIITGLPGNPFAAFVGFGLFAGPQIKALAGEQNHTAMSVPAIASFEWDRKPGRAEVFPVRCLGYTSAGVPRLERLGQSVSATLFPLAEADGVALVSRETTRVIPDDPIVWFPFSTKSMIP